MARILLLLAIFLAPLYLWPSGLPQIGHLVAFLAITLHVLTKPKLHWERAWVTGVLFVFYSAVVNIIVFLQYGDARTLASTIYYAFDFMVFLLVVSYSASENLGRSFVEKIFWIHLTQLITLVMFSYFNLGRTYGAFRTTAFFNDPNQMGNWLLWTAIIVAATGRALYRTWSYGVIALGIAFVGAVFTASRSTLLGLSTILLVYGVNMALILIKERFMRFRKKSVLKFIVSTAIVIIITISGFAFYSSVPGLNIQNRFSIQKRVSYVFDRFFQEHGADETLEGRGYSRLWVFPEYLIFGSGEGANWRYGERTQFLGEIHSSWAGVLFYYGIVGSALLWGFVFSILNSLRKTIYKALFLGPFIYGFAIYNLRNWYFWIGMAVLYSSCLLVRKSESKEETHGR